MKKGIHLKSKTLADNLKQSRENFRSTGLIRNFYGGNLWVTAEVNELLFINDGFSQSVEETYNSIQKIEHPVSLIIGGLNGLQNYSLLNGGVNDKLVNIFTYGVGALPLLKKLEALNVNLHEAHSLKNAVNLSFAIADKQSVVLFSPASQPVEFKSIEERVELFELYVKKLGLK
jgi:UDP-N-acetylmuramoylalanine--D-glutamate ligase